MRYAASPPFRGFQLAVLDMAGTTVDEHGAVTDSVASAFRFVGREAPPAPSLVPLRGRSKREMFARLIDDPLNAQEAHAAFIDAMRAAVSGGTVEPKPGAEALLRDLRERGIKVCLATGFDAAIRDHLLAQLSWDQLVDLALCPDDVQRGRPFPDLILTAALKLQVDAVQEVLVAGDTTNDLLAGYRAGAGATVGVLGGAHDRAALAAAPHTHLAERVDEVSRILDGTKAITGRNP